LWGAFGEVIVFKQETRGIDDSELATIPDTITVQAITSGAG
jgi:hypothetical protein